MKAFVSNCEKVTLAILLAFSLSACSKMAGTEASSSRSVLTSIGNDTNIDTGPGTSNGDGGSGISGNGNGYDGKVYSRRLPGAEVCSDGSNVEMSITVQSSGDGYLTRENCTTLMQPMLLAQGSFTIINAETIAYNGVQLSSGTPIVTIDRPLPGIITGFFKVEGLCSANGNPITMYLGTNTINATCVNGAYTTPNLSIPVGSYTFRVTHTDFAGTTAEATVSVTVQ